MSKEKCNFTITRFRYAEPLTAGLLEHQIRTRRLTFWDINSCSRCKYRCGFRFYILKIKLIVYFDEGCDCKNSLMRPADLSDVINYLNFAQDEDLLRNYYKFWFGEGAEPSLETYTEKLLLI